jgi:ribosome-associated protein
VNDEATDGLGTLLDKPSRTRKKRAAEEVQKTGEQLLSLGDAQLDALELMPELREAVVVARGINSRGARRRQLQYIGTLMRRIDAQELRQRLDGLALEASEEARQFKQVERWRDELSAGDRERFEWLLANYPDMDPDWLERLTQAAGKDKPTAEQRKAGKALFRFLRKYI